MSLILLGITPFIPLPLVNVFFSMFSVVLLVYSRRWTTVIALALTGCGAATALVPAYSDLLQQAQ